MVQVMDIKNVGKMKYYEVDVSDKFLSWDGKIKIKFYPVGNIGFK